MLLLEACDAVQRVGQMLGMVLMVVWIQNTARKPYLWFESGPWMDASSCHHGSTDLCLHGWWWPQLQMMEREWMMPFVVGENPDRELHMHM